MQKKAKKIDLTKSVKKEEDDSGLIKTKSNGGQIKYYDIEENEISRIKKEFDIDEVDGIKRSKTSQEDNKEQKIKHRNTILLKENDNQNDQKLERSRTTTNSKKNILQQFIAKKYKQPQLERKKALKPEEYNNEEDIKDDLKDIDKKGREKKKVKFEENFEQKIATYTCKGKLNAIKDDDYNKNIEKNTYDFMNIDEFIERVQKPEGYKQKELFNIFIDKECEMNELQKYRQPIGFWENLCGCFRDNTYEARVKTNAVIDTIQEYYNKQQKLKYYFEKELNNSIGNIKNQKKSKLNLSFDNENSNKHKNYKSKYIDDINIVKFDTKLINEIKKVCNMAY